jgi:hypothetical protein
MSDFVLAHELQQRLPEALASYAATMSAQIELRDRAKMI